MKNRNYALIIILSIFCSTFMFFVNTIPVGAVSQQGFESRMHGLERFSKENPAIYKKMSELCMEEIREGAWSYKQIKKVVDAGYLQEYKNELIGIGYYIPDNTQPQSNETPTNDAGSSYSAVFNAEYYMNKYPDLKANIGNNAAALLNHFLTIGMAEGRQGSEEFNLAIYKKKNPDLVAVYGDNNSAYYYHYITNGKAEKRIAK